MRERDEGTAAISCPVRCTVILLLNHHLLHRPRLRDSEEHALSGGVLSGSFRPGLWRHHLCLPRRLRRHRLCIEENGAGRETGSGHSHYNAQSHHWRAHRAGNTVYFLLRKKERMIRYPGTLPSPRFHYGENITGYCDVGYQFRVFKRLSRFYHIFVTFLL